MNKILKRGLLILGLLLCIIITIDNIIYMSVLRGVDEYSQITYLTLKSIGNVIAIIIVIIGFSYIVQKIKMPKRVSNILIGVLLVTYVAIQVIWINHGNLIAKWDQGEIYEAAKQIAEGQIDNLKGYSYFELYSYQLPLVSIYSIAMKVFHTTSPKLLEYMNAIFNAASVLGLYLILDFLSKKYKVNRVLFFILTLTFIPVIILSNFIYGDFIGFTMAVYGIYFIMLYGQKNQFKFVVISAVFMAIGNMMRTNNLIFIIALSIYLFLLLMENWKVKKERINQIIAITTFITIALVPNVIVKNTMIHKLELNKEKAFPSSGFFLMGMSEGPRANGWYNLDITKLALIDGKVEEAKQLYPTQLMDRVTDLIRNPLYALQFYHYKIVSMWTEPTYECVVFCHHRGREDNQEEKYKQLLENLTNAEGEIRTYQKALMLIIFGRALFVLIQNRKNISNELILLVTIFIGGFFFHILWEGKSRYILPYVLSIIPIACIGIKSLKKERKNTRKLKLLS